MPHHSQQMHSQQAETLNIGLRLFVVVLVQDREPV